jgi:RNA polymerase sigma-70 factor (ECF subfamily)
MVALTQFHSQAADTALARSARDGNRAAFGALYERYKPMVHGILLAHVPYADAEDLMQTVFMQAMQRLPTLRDAEAFGGWLTAIARNLAFDYHRRRKNLVEIGQLDEAHGSRVHSRTHSCEAEAALAAIHSLPEAYRETLMLRLVEGMTGPEIAARTGLTPDSVRVNLCRGMKLLRSQLGGDHE